MERFSPAGAGNTKVVEINYSDNPVQPRGCGEHTGTVLAGDVVTGSAPRVRGTLRGPAAGMNATRFSPAGAGNTWQCLQLAHMLPVQPRGCGEHK